MILSIAVNGQIYLTMCMAHVFKFLNGEEVNDIQT